MKLILVRHGDIVHESESRVIPLSAEGRNQIKALCPQLEGYNLYPVIFSSPYERAAQSALILATVFNMDIIHLQGLADIGEFKGFSGYHKILITSFVDYVREICEGKDVIIVSHGGPISMMQDYLTGSHLPCDRGKFVVVEVA